jgi:hypothetical protein
LHAKTLTGFILHIVEEAFQMKAHITLGLHDILHRSDQIHNKRKPKALNQMLIS